MMVPLPEKLARQEKRRVRVLAVVFVVLLGLVFVVGWLVRPC